MTCGVVMIIVLVSLITHVTFGRKAYNGGLHALLEAHSWLN